MFVFYSKLSDDEFKESIINIQNRSDVDFNFMKILKEIEPSILLHVNRISTQYKLDPDDKNVLLNFANMELFSFIKRFDLKRYSTKDFTPIFVFHLKTALIDEVQKIIGTVDLGSPPTRRLIHDVLKFVSDYYSDNKRFPAVEQIAKKFNKSPKAIQTYIDAFNLFNVQSLEKMVGHEIGEHQPTISDFLSDERWDPERQYFDYQDKVVLNKALAETKSFFTSEQQKILSLLIEMGGRASKEILTKGSSGNNMLIHVICGLMV